MTTTVSAINRAGRYVLDAARPLEQARWSVAFEGGNAGALVHELRAFQNPDGGFGRAIEPDLRATGSSGLGLATAMHILREARAAWGAEATCQIVKGAAEWLMKTQDPESLSWSAVPEDLDTADHAPWWQPSAPSDCLDNPRPELLAFALDHSWAFAETWTEALVQSVFDRFHFVPIECEMHTFLSYASLLGCPLSPEHRDVLAGKLLAMAKAVVVTDPEQWQGYTLRPGDAFPQPVKGLSEPFEDAIRIDLQARMEAQQPDGSWRPVWSWEGEEWQKAEREWAGVLTFLNAKRLRDYSMIG